jgi:CxxC motif-containing protein (DUF1111 family)
MRYRKRFLHDRRAATIEEAIAAHGGQAEPVVRGYKALPEADRRRLVEFVGSL